MFMKDPGTHCSLIFPFLPASPNRDKLLAGGGTYVEEGNESNHNSPAGASAVAPSPSSSVGPSPYANKTPASMSQKAAAAAAAGSGGAASTGGAAASKNAKASGAPAENDEFSSLFGTPLKKVRGVEDGRGYSVG